MFTTRLTRTILAVAAAAPLIVSAGVEAADPDISVKLMRVNENRSRTLAADPKKKSIMFDGSFLHLQLRFEGKDVEKATRVGNLKLTTAKDNKGNDLKARSGMISMKSLTRIRRSRGFSSDEPPPADRHEVTLTFGAPPRTAEKIDEVKAELTFRVAETETVSLPLEKLTSLQGKEIDSPVLKKMGLTVTVENARVTGGANIRLKIAGEKRDAVFETRILDAKGKRLDSGSFTHDLLKTVSSSTSAFARNQADFKGAKFELVLESQYKDVPVKIELEDVPLP